GLTRGRRSPLSGDAGARQPSSDSAPRARQPGACTRRTERKRMKLAALATALLLPLAVLAQDKPAAKAAAKDKEPPLAKVNGVAVPASYLEFMMQQQRGRGTPDNPQTRQMMRDEL